MKSKPFEEILDAEFEAKAWKAIKDVIHGILGKRRSLNYQTAVQTMLKYFEPIGVNMSFKIHLMHHHLNVLENQRATESDEQGERYHQVALPFEKRYEIIISSIQKHATIYIIYISDTKESRNWIRS